MFHEYFLANYVFCVLVYVYKYSFCAKNQNKNRKTNALLPLIHTFGSVNGLFMFRKFLLSFCLSRCLLSSR